MKKEKIKTVNSPVFSKNKLKSAIEVSEFDESVINTVREPLLVLDQELKVIKASRSFYEFFKVSSDETIGKLIYNLGNDQWDIPKLRELLETILPEKTAFDNYEVEHDFATIGKRIMLLNARQIERASGKDKVILLAIEDITERKHIEAGLDKTRKELAVIKISADEISEFAENLIDTVREPLLVLDQELKVIKASRSFYEFFKVSSDETIGKLIYNLGNDQWDIPKLRELLETILPEKTTFDNYEVEHDFATIGKRIMLLNAQQIKRAFGKEKMILLAIEDITERKLAEAELSKYQDHLKELVEELRTSNQELEAFAYSVSHDLRAPLRAINGFTRILLQDYVERLDDEAKRLGSVIQKNSQKMGQLIDDLLAFSRLGRATMHFSNIDMKKMVNEVYEEATTPSERKRINFSITELFIANGDPNMFRQVWINLISNALKFSANQKQAVISVTCREEEDKLNYCIKDNGAGFNMKYIDKLFRVFQRLHSEKEYPGTGVGLALVKRIIQRHGGKIWAEGEIGKGAAFYFSLPKK